MERKRKNRIIRLEEEIAKLEGEIKQLGDELLKDENATNYEKAMEITAEIDEKKNKLEGFYTEWKELNF